MASVRLAFLIFISAISAALDQGRSTARAADGKPTLLVFGDSLSDTGRTAGWAKDLPFSIGKNMLIRSHFATHYCRGRVSNGKVWAEFLSERRGFNLENQAYAGALSSQRAFGNNPVPDAKETLEAYTKKHPAPGAEALAIVWIGSNNYYLHEYNPKLSEGRNEMLEKAQVRQALWDIEDMIRRLAQAGRKRIAIPKVGPIQDTPYGRGLGIRERESIRKMVADHNAGLTALIERLKKQPQFRNVQLGTVETYDAMEDAISHPEKYAYRDTRGCCYAASGCPPPPKTPVCDPGEKSGPPPIPVWTQAFAADHAEHCTDPDGKIFWDALHPTTKSHCLLSFVFEDDLVRQGLLSPPARPTTWPERVQICSGLGCPNGGGSSW